MSSVLKDEEFELAFDKFIKDIETAEIPDYSNKGFDLFRAACWKGKTSAVETLFSIPWVDISSKDFNGLAPLHIACILGHTDIVKELTLTGDINEEALYTGETPLHYACREGHIDIVKELLSKRAKVNKTMFTGETPLHYACREGHIDIVKELLNRGGVEVNEKTENTGDTPLHYAYINRHIGIAGLLLDRGADESIENKEGNIPSYYDKTKYFEYSEYSEYTEFLENNNDSNDSRYFANNQTMFSSGIDYDDRSTSDDEEDYDNIFSTPQG